jgi:predicted nucleic acid-binding protein
MWARHHTLLRHGTVPTVPTVVIAQAWRSPRQVALARLIRGCSVEDFTAATARAVGARAARTRHPDIVDLAVADGALRRGDRVFTSDPRDLEVAGVPAARLLLV